MKSAAQETPIEEEEE